MIGYITLGTNRYEEAAAFYDALFASIDKGRVWEDERFICWGAAPDTKVGAMHPALFSIVKPYDGKRATVGNGVMVALGLETSAQVDAFYNKALALGATDDGAPGSRSKHFYGCYFRDLDGNKLAAYCMLP